MERYREIEKSIIKTYRKDIWSKFIKAVKDYDLIKENDHIAVCISGGKDSFLLAKCFDELKRHNQYQFKVSFISMNPGFSEMGMDKIKENSELLNIDLDIFESPIFKIVTSLTDGNPCYLCARMRRGYLYDYAKQIGANKIALAHHFDDVIETNMLNLLYAGKIATMPAILSSANHEGMQLIRPLFYVREQSILNWVNYNNLEFINCDCPLLSCKGPSKRREMKNLIKDFEKTYKDIPKNIFTAFKDK